MVVLKPSSASRPSCRVARFFYAVNVSEIPCSPLYRFGFGWEHLITTNMFDAIQRGFTLNQTEAMGGPLYAPTIHIPNVTQPLYEVQNPSSAHTSMVNTD